MFEYCNIMYNILRCGALCNRADNDLQLCLVVELPHSERISPSTLLYKGNFPGAPASKINSNSSQSCQARKSLLHKQSQLQRVADSLISSPSSRSMEPTIRILSISWCTSSLFPPSSGQHWSFVPTQDPLSTNRCGHLS